MALTVEDGTGVAGADSYLSLSDADAYHEARNNTAWAAFSDDEKEGRLRRAAQYVDGHYRPRLKGIKVAVDQSLAWPRSGVEDEDGYALPIDEVPGGVVDAQVEMAADITESQSTSSPQRLKRAKAGSVEVEYEASATTRQVVTFVDELMRPYLFPSGRITKGA